MAKLIFKDIKKIYPPDVTAVKEFNLEIQDKEFMVFVGPSGCGKSTVLRMIAGLEEITQGELYIGDRLINKIEAKDRDIAMVFQNYALYPHLTAFKNMSFGLEVRKTKKKEIFQKVMDAAKMLEIEHLLDRKPGALSGGEKQRVAIGRAIIRNPEVFLFDEPLSNLDAKLRANMRKELIKLHKKLNTTFIYVTHDQVEAMTMADKIVIMDKGLIQQVGTPAELYNNPANIFVADFIGTPSINLITARVTEDEKCSLNIHNAIIPIEDTKGNFTKLKAYQGKEITVGIRPKDISFSEEGKDVIYMGELKVNQIENTGSEQFAYGTLGEEDITVQCPSEAIIEQEKIYKIYGNLSKASFFDAENGLNISLRL